MLHFVLEPSPFPAKKKLLCATFIAVFLFLEEENSRENCTIEILKFEEVAIKTAFLHI